jgi:hypothetical protein
MSQAGSFVQSGAGPLPPQVSTTFVTDVNSPAIPALNILDVFGSDTTTNNILGLQTDGSSGSNVLTIQLTNRFHSDDGGGNPVVTTTDATPTTIATCPMSTNPAVFRFTVELVAYDVTDNSGFTTISSLSFLTNGGVPTLLIPEDHVTQESAGNTFPASTSVNLQGTSTNFNVIVTGAVGKTINWLCHGTYTMVS